MTMLATYQKLAPSWLTDGDGGKVLASLATMYDTFAQRTRDALNARFPATAPDDVARAAMGRDRRITRGISEPSAAYAARLVRAFDDLQVRGNPYALIAQVQAYLQIKCVVSTVDAATNWFTIDAAGTRTTNIASSSWTWDAQPAFHWSRYWLIINTPSPTQPWAETGLFGAVGAVAESDTLGTTATPDQVATLKQIVRDWSPANARCEWIVINYDSTYYSDASPAPKLPDGTFGDWSKISNGVRVASRFPVARYFSGSDR